MFDSRSSFATYRTRILSAVILALLVLALAVTLLVRGGHGERAADAATSQSPRPPTSAATSASRPAAPPAKPTTSASGLAALSGKPVQRKTATRAATPPAKAPLTYTVKSGDNLTVIAAWFKLHGYGSLYEKNKAVIGADPNLIRPGERITISSTGMTTSD